MLIIDIKARRKVKWTFCASGPCEHCHNQVRHKVVHIWQQVSLYFVIPLLAYARKWVVECPVCNFRREITSEQANSPTMTLNDCFAE